jgi:hypothetical protein
MENDGESEALKADREDEGSRLPGIKYRDVGECVGQREINRNIQDARNEKPREQLVALWLPLVHGPGDHADREEDSR